MKTNIIILVGAALAIWIMFQVPGPKIEASLPEPPLAITPEQYEKLPDKRGYGKWEWQDVVFWCPHCRAQYTLKIKEPRTSYFRYITDHSRMISKDRELSFPDISFWIIQLTRMERETGKGLIFKCRKCGKVFGLPTLDGFGWSRIPIAGVSGWNVGMK